MKCDSVMTDNHDGHTISSIFLQQLINAGGDGVFQENMQGFGP